MNMSDKVKLPFTEITRRLRALPLPEVDCVVGIARGGIVPASLLAFHLQVPLAILQINYRADDNTPQRDQPALLEARELPDQPSHVLLVDDVSVSGKTLDFAKTLLPQHTLTTCVLKGSADFVAFPDVPECVDWVWKVDALEVSPT